LINLKEGEESVDCVAWTYEINEYGKPICVRKATDPDSITFTVFIEDLQQMGDLTLFGVFAYLTENLKDYEIYAIGSKGDVCDYE